MNMPKTVTAPIGVGLVAVLLLGLAGCKSVSQHLPWGHKAPAPPEVSTALTVTTAEGGALALPQFWQRNDVVLDLTGVAPTGAAVVMPRSGLAWPVRLALRVTPGVIGAIDVRGAQRVLLPVPAAGGQTDIELPPGVYVASTKQVTLSWGPANVPASP
jgi:hypothetical protein